MASPNKAASPPINTAASGVMAQKLRGGLLISWCYRWVSR
jgi:hypothetical protein